ncbi:MAG: hypothetical protein ACPLPT_05340 [Moorellales bacterium]
MWLERRFLSGLITGSMLGLIAGAMFLTRSEGREMSRREAVRRVTGWLKK